MRADLLSPPFADAIEKYLKRTNYIVIFLLDEQLTITDYNDAFPLMMNSRESLLGKNILDFLLMESRHNHPFRNPPPEPSQRLIFISPDSSSCSLNCAIFRIENNYLVLGGHPMLSNDQVIERMTLLSNELINITRKLHQKNKALVDAQAQIKVLGGLIPICSFCKEIRDDKGYWNQLEKFITENSEALFSHAICPKCLKIHFPEYHEDKK